MRGRYPDTLKHLSEPNSARLQTLSQRSSHQNALELLPLVGASVLVVPRGAAAAVSMGCVVWQLHLTIAWHLHLRVPWQAHLRFV